MREQARETLMLEEAEEELARIRKDYYGNSAKVFTQVMVGTAGPEAGRICDAAADRSDIARKTCADRHRASNDRKRGREAGARRACSVLVFRRRKPLSGIETGQPQGNRASRIARSE
jgi:hypothetical protein